MTLIQPTYRGVTASVAKDHFDGSVPYNAIFAIFFHLNDKSSRSYEGTQLELHGWRLWTAGGPH